jgi:hypothetical protein
MRRASTAIKLLIFLLTAISANAQFRVLKNIDEIEFTMGPSFVSLYNENITDNLRQPKIGYSAKIGLLYSLNENFSVNINFLFQRKGLKTKYEVSYYDPSIDSTNCQCTTSQGFQENNSSLDYLMIAPLMRFFPRKTNLYIDVGPFAGYLLKAKTKTTNLWDHTNYYGNGNDSFKKTDFGIIISFGYRVQIKDGTHLILELTDSIGLLNVSTTSTNTTTNAFSFALGVSHKIK